MLIKINNAAVMYLTANIIATYYYYSGVVMSERYLCFSYNNCYKNSAIFAMKFVHILRVMQTKKS